MIRFEQKFPIRRSLESRVKPSDPSSWKDGHYLGMFGLV